MSNTTHSALSPSKRARFARCPGSAKYPEQAGPSNPSAIDGTHSHTLLERCVKAGLTDPLGTINATFEDHEGQFTVDAERAQRVKVAIDYVRGRWQPGFDVQAETRVDPERLVGRADMGGTYDISIHGGNVFELIDYKDGMHAVSAENNLQLEHYAIGVLAEFPVRPYPFTEMWLTIIQPKLAAKGMNPISTWKTTVDAVMDRVGALKREGAACDDPNAPLIAGDEQCKWCPAKGSCAELARHTLASAGISFPSVELSLPAAAGAHDLVEQAVDRDPATMSNEQLVKVLHAAPLLRQMLEGAEKEALRRLQANVGPAELKVVAGRGSRKWALPEAEMAEKLKSLGLPKDVIWQTSLISPAQIEKAVWNNRKGEQKTLTPKQRATVDKEYVARVAGKPTVAFASDDRPAIVNDASSLFGAIAAPIPAQAPALPDWMK